MAARDPGVRHISARIGAVERHHGPDDPRLAQLRTDLAVESLAEHIRYVAESAPAPTPDQIRRLRALLPPLAMEASAA